MHESLQGVVYCSLSPFLAFYFMKGHRLRSEPAQVDAFTKLDAAKLARFRESYPSGTSWRVDCAQVSFRSRTVVIVTCCKISTTLQENQGIRK